MQIEMDAWQMNPSQRKLRGSAAAEGRRNNRSETTVRSLELLLGNFSVVCCCPVRSLGVHGHEWCVVYTAQVRIINLVRLHRTMGRAKRSWRRYQNSTLHQGHFERRAKHLTCRNPTHSRTNRHILHSQDHDIFSSSVVQAWRNIVDVFIRYAALPKVPGKRSRTHHRAGLVLLCVLLVGVVPQQ